MKKIIAILSVTMLFLAACSAEKTKEKEEERNPNGGKETSIEEKEIKEKGKEQKVLTFTETNVKNIATHIFGDIHSNELQTFGKTYADVKGVLTFRGNHLRDSPSYGSVDFKKFELEKFWEFTTGSRSWGGGAGWTGQPSIIEWDEEVKQMMNIKDEFKEKKNFREVIYASLDGRIYFLDLETGKQTRKPIDIENPIKGSLSLDPRGYPILYVGQGIPEKGEIGYRIYSLIDGEMLYFINGLDPVVYRYWGAFDGAALINKETDTLFLGGENGLFYQVYLNTKFDLENKHIKMDPETVKYRYKIEGNDYQGIENSVAIYKNVAYFADNGGSIQAVDTTTMKPVWALPKTDDTDATIVIEEENNIPYLYTGTEVDKQGQNGVSTLRKINGLTGKVIWKKEIPAYSLIGEDPVNGGMLATPVIGKNKISDLIIFTVARYKTFNGGLTVALDKETGKEIWRYESPGYSWSSPIDVYNKKGEGYIIQSNSIGNMYLLDGRTGERYHDIHLGSNIEASPAVFDDTLVVASRGGQIFGIKLK